MTSDNTTNPNNDLGVLLIDYLPRLVRLAEKNMSVGLKKRVDPDEMANSVLGSVIRMQAEGKLMVDVENSSEFGSLITTIALNKIRKKARFHQSQKRDYRREVAPSDDGPTLAEMLQQAGDPTDADGASLARILEQLEETLDEDGKIVLAGKREKKIAEEIAGKLNGGKGRSTKTVQRIWDRIHVLAKSLSEQEEL